MRPPSPLRLKMQPQAVLFDWDNTLIDHDHLVTLFSDQWVREMGKPPYPTPEEMNQQWAADHRAFFSRYFPDVPPEDVSKRFHQLMAEVPPEKVRLFEGVRELLDTLRSKGVRMAVVSNKPEERLKAEVAASGLSDYFEVVRGYNAPTTPDAPKPPKKPDPRPITDTLLQMGIPLGRVWYVGDMMDDAGAARSDGIQRFIVRERHRGRIQREAIGHDPEGGIIYLDDINAMRPYAEAVLPRKSHDIVIR